MAAEFKKLRRSFTHSQVQHILDLRFGSPANYAQPLRTFKLIQSLTGLRPSTSCLLCSRFLQLGQIQIRRVISNITSQLNQREREFLLDLQELRNFGLAKRADLFKAMFGKPMSRQNVHKFYQENKVKYGKPTRLFNRAIHNQI